MCVMMMMLISQLSIALKKIELGSLKLVYRKGLNKGRWREGRRNREAVRQTKVGGREGGRRGGKADCAGGITDIIALANLANLKVESPSG